MDGAEVAQMYVCAPKGKIFRPDKELKGFAKSIPESRRKAEKYRFMTFGSRK